MEGSAAIPTALLLSIASSASAVTATSSSSAVPSSSSSTSTTAICSSPLPPLVFLDVDGVLVTTRCLVEEPSLSDPSVLYPPSFTTPLERACLVQLATLVRCSQCRIVLTSTWRNYPDMLSALKFALGQYGLLDALVGATPRAKDRGAEVVAWLTANPHGPRFVILEDSQDHIASFIAAPALRKRYVQTIPLHGLTQDKVDEALAVLGLPPSSA
jgi:hypothetical protein